MRPEAAIPYVRAFRLTKHTSETLNWIENFWGYRQETYFGRMLTEQRKEFYPNAVRLLRRLRRSGHLRYLAFRPSLNGFSLLGLAHSISSSRAKHCLKLHKTTHKPDFAFWVYLRLRAQSRPWFDALIATHNPAHHELRRNSANRF